MVIYALKVLQSIVLFVAGKKEVLPFRAQHKYKIANYSLLFLSIFLDLIIPDSVPETIVQSSFREWCWCHIESQGATVKASLGDKWHSLIFNNFLQGDICSLDITRNLISLRNILLGCLGPRISLSDFTRLLRWHFRFLVLETGVFIRCADVKMVGTIGFVYMC